MKTSTTIRITDDFSLTIQDWDCNKCSTYTLKYARRTPLEFEELTALSHAVTKILLQQHKRRQAL